MKSLKITLRYIQNELNLIDNDKWNWIRIIGCCHNHVYILCTCTQRKCT